MSLYREILLEGIQNSTENYDFDSISAWIQERRVLDAAGNLLENININKRKKRVLLALSVMSFDDEIFSENAHDIRMKGVAKEFISEFIKYLKNETTNVEFITNSIQEYENWLQTDRQILLQFEMNSSP